MQSVSIPVTLLYGGLSALLLVVLGANVSAQRGKYKSFIGDATPPELQRVIRAHGNAAEWIPLGIVMLLCLELHGLGGLALHLLGGAFVLGRFLHATGVIMKSPITVPGAAINYLSLGVMSGWAVYLHFVK